MYKAGQGMTSRMGMAALGLLLGLYAGYSWYGWTYVTPKHGNWLSYFLNVSFLGAIILLVGITAIGYYLSFHHPRTCDYFIDMDGELRKVIWPSVLPLFDAKTEAWGSTYVVIFCTFLLTIFIGLVDVVLQFLISTCFLKWLLT